MTESDRRRESSTISSSAARSGWRRVEVGLWGATALLLSLVLLVQAGRRKDPAPGEPGAHPVPDPAATAPVGARTATPAAPEDIDRLLRKLRQACRLEQMELIQKTKREIVDLGPPVFLPALSEATGTAEIVYLQETLYFTSLGDVLLLVVRPEDDDIILDRVAAIDVRRPAAPTAQQFAKPTEETVVLALLAELLSKGAGPRTAEKVMAAYRKSRRTIVKQALLRVLARLQDSNETLRNFLIGLLDTEQDAGLLAEIILALGELRDPRVAPELYQKLQQLYKRGNSGGTLDALVAALLAQLKLPGTLPLLLSRLDQKSLRTDPIELGAALAQTIAEGKLSAEDLQLLIASLTAEKRPAQIAMLLKAVSASNADDPRLAPLARLLLQSSDDPSVRQAAVGAILTFEKDPAKFAEGLNWAFDCGSPFVARTTATQVAVYTVQHPEAGTAIDVLKNRALTGTPESRAAVIEQMGAPWLWDATPDVYSDFLRGMQSTEKDPQVLSALQKALSGEKNLMQYLKHAPLR